MLLRMIIGIGSMAICSSLLYVCARGVGPLPALGPLLDPARGIWHNKAAKTASEVKLPGLEADATVRWDARDIPYIYAPTSRALYQIQGYVTASKRLWQMDFLARAAAGRLSEAVGAMTLDMDKFNRAVGLPLAAEILVATAKKNPTTWSALEAYAQGVNDYIATLDDKTNPVEYKFLNLQPEPWTPTKSALVFVAMAWQLSGYDARAELRRTNTLAQLGADAFNRIFPFKRPWAHPMVPSSTSTTSPDASKPDAATPPPRYIPLDAGFWPPQGLGSNAWTVRIGEDNKHAAILASDPHLGLTLPSIWFLNQLADGKHVALGASIPGLPGVIVGTNAHYAWSLTNSGLDAVDWFEVKFKDESWREYEHNGAWRPTTVREERIRVKGRADEVVVPLTMTHQGPVAFGYDREGGRTGLAMRWTGHEPLNALGVFLLLNWGNSQDAFKNALTNLSAPALNLLYVDGSGNIAAYTAGAVPNRAPGQGRQVSTMANQPHDWNGFLPAETNPRIENPPSGRIISANQDPLSASDPRYLGIFPPEYRARRIETLLQSATLHNFDVHRNLQLDEKCIEAETVLPKLLSLVAREELSSVERTAVELLDRWDATAAANAPEASIYDAWWKAFRTVAWQEEAGANSSTMEGPGSDIYALWLTDNRASSAESPITQKALRQLATRTFRQGVATLTQTYGDDPKNWLWGHVNGLELPHVSRIPGFGHKRLHVGGGLQSINAVHKAYGPSLRLVVHFDASGPQVIAAYPGGQSGHPDDPRSTEFVEDFVAGKLTPLRFARAETDLHADEGVTQTFRSIKP